MSPMNATFMFAGSRRTFETRASSAAYGLISMPLTFAGPTPGNWR